MKMPLCLQIACMIVLDRGRFSLAMRQKPLISRTLPPTLSPSLAPTAFSTISTLEQDDDCLGGADDNEAKHRCSQNNGSSGGSGMIFIYIVVVAIGVGLILCLLKPAVYSLLSGLKTCTHNLALCCSNTINGIEGGLQDRVEGSGQTESGSNLPV